MTSQTLRNTAVNMKSTESIINVQSEATPLSTINVNTNYTPLTTDNIIRELTRAVNTLFIRFAVQGSKIKELRIYDGDRSNKKLNDYIRDVINWIDFYNRRSQWAYKEEKVQQTATYLTGRIHRLYKINKSHLTTVPEYLNWLREMFRDNNELYRLRD